MSKKPENGDVISQRERFIKAAKEAETDDDPDAFRERLKRLVSAPKPPKKQPKPKKPKAAK